MDSPDLLERSSSRTTMMIAPSQTQSEETAAANPASEFAMHDKYNSDGNGSSWRVSSPDLNDDAAYGDERNLVDASGAPEARGSRETSSQVLRTVPGGARGGPGSQGMRRSRQTDDVPPGSRGSRGRSRSLSRSSESVASRSSNSVESVSGDKRDGWTERRFKKQRSNSPKCHATSGGLHLNSRGMAVRSAGQQLKTGQPRDSESSGGGLRNSNLRVSGSPYQTGPPSSRSDPAAAHLVVDRVVFISKRQREQLKSMQQRESKEGTLGIGPAAGYQKQSWMRVPDSRSGGMSPSTGEQPLEMSSRYGNRPKSTDDADSRASSRSLPYRMGASPSPSFGSEGSKCSTTQRSRDTASHFDSGEATEDPSASRSNASGSTSGSTSETFAKSWDNKTQSDLGDLLRLAEIDLKNVQQVNDVELIRDHYLGLRKERRRIQKPSEKFRNIFNFEWNVSEDTARSDTDVLYQSRLEPQLLFGRGFRAGIDVREQRRHNNFYDELVKCRSERTGEGVGNISKSLVGRSRDIDVNDPNKTHWTEKDRHDMSERDWRIFREDFEIYVKGGRVPPPIRKWEEASMPQQLLDAIRQIGYEKPTPIQMQAIPIALEQRDLIGIAETGSGKTAAFVLPMLAYVKELPPLSDETSQDGPYALVLAPSRELAIQIDEETKKFASFCRCRAVAVVGGRSAEVQAFELRRGAEIVIGTPGRVKDCLDRSYTVLSQCNYVILDEADRMIDMGFEEVVNWILDQIPTTNLKSENESLAYQQELEAKAGYRQYRLTHMFSATMPPSVERLARKYLRAPAYISVGQPGAGKRAIEQRLEFITEARKKQRLMELLQDAEPPVMVFVNQKKVADILCKAIHKAGFNVDALHGGKAQENREQALQEFKQGQVDILVATDVAGRGIDIDSVQLVINFDMPKDIGTYTHRIGRTGRAGKKGLAISFCTDDDSNIFYDLKQLLISTKNAVPAELSQHKATKAKAAGLPAASGTNGTSSMPA